MDSTIRQALKEYIANEKSLRDKVQDMDLSECSNEHDMYRISSIRQKFFNYLLKQDEANSRKYHQKIIDWEMGELEELSSREGEYNVAIFEGLDKMSQFKNEGGYLQIADDIKEYYDFRVKLIKHIFG